MESSSSSDEEEDLTKVIQKKSKSLPRNYKKTPRKEDVRSYDDTRISQPQIVIYVNDSSNQRPLIEMHGNPIISNSMELPSRSQGFPAAEATRDPMERIHETS